MLRASNTLPSVAPIWNTYDILRNIKNVIPPTSSVTGPKRNFSCEVCTYNRNTARLGYDEVHVHTVNHLLPSLIIYDIVIPDFGALTTSCSELCMQTKNHILIEWQTVWKRKCKIILRYLTRVWANVSYYSDNSFIPIKRHVALRYQPNNIKRSLTPASNE